MADERLLTNEQLAAIAERADRATLGPWGVCAATQTSDWTICELAHWPRANGLGRSDALFISNARTDVPALLAHTRAQAERVAALVAMLRRVEWGGYGSYYDEGNHCPLCHGGALKSDYPAKGHEDDCALAALLAKHAEGE